MGAHNSRYSNDLESGKNNINDSLMGLNHLDGNSNDLESKVYIGSLSEKENEYDTRVTMDSYGEIILHGNSGTLDEKLGFKTEKRKKSFIKCTDEAYTSLEVEGDDDNILSRNIIINKSIKYGEGTYGVTYKATNKFTGMEYAVKIIDKRKFDDYNLKIISKESSITSGLNHPNVIKTHLITENVCTIKFFMDLVSGGTLFDYVNRFESLNDCRTYLLFKQMLDGVEYLHNEKYIVHHDIKLENILISNDKDLHVYLIDFGFSFIRMPGDPLSEEYSGTPLYASPELLKGIPNDGFPADIWALGVCLYAMSTGELPFNVENRHQLHHRVINGIYDRYKITDPELNSLVDKMLHLNPRARAKIPEIKNHPWMKKWEKYIKEHTNCDGKENIPKYYKS